MVSRSTASRLAVLRLVAAFPRTLLTAVESSISCCSTIEFSTDATTRVRDTAAAAGLATARSSDVPARGSSTAAPSHRPGPDAGPGGERTPRPAARRDPDPTRHGSSRGPDHGRRACPPPPLCATCVPRTARGTVDGPDGLDTDALSPILHPLSRSATCAPPCLADMDQHSRPPTSREPPRPPGNNEPSLDKRASNVRPSDLGECPRPRSPAVDALQWPA